MATPEPEHAANAPRPAPAPPGAQGSGDVFNSLCWTDYLTCNLLDDCVAGTLDEGGNQAKAAQARVSASDAGQTSAGGDLLDLIEYEGAEDSLGSTKSGGVNKATREKLRRERLNDRFGELANILNLSGPNLDKLRILSEAIRVLKSLQEETAQLKSTNQRLHLANTMTSEMAGSILQARQIELQTGQPTSKRQRVEQFSSTGSLTPEASTEQPQFQQPPVPGDSSLTLLQQQLPPTEHRRPPHLQHLIHQPQPPLPRQRPFELPPQQSFQQPPTQPSFQHQHRQQSFQPPQTQQSFPQQAQPFQQQVQPFQQSPQHFPQSQQSQQQQFQQQLPQPSPSPPPSELSQQQVSQMKFLHSSGGGTVAGVPSAWISTWPDPNSGLWMPPGSLDTSQDHLLRPPVA